jgi:hypothetical protein
MDKSFIYLIYSNVRIAQYWSFVNTLIKKKLFFLALAVQPPFFLKNGGNSTVCGCNNQKTMINYL